MIGASPVHEYPLTIKESLLDPLGHVNNASYLQVFEEARWEISARQGLMLKDMLKSGVVPVVLEMQVRFVKEVTNRESVVIRTQFMEYSGLTWVADQAMVKADGETACHARLRFGLLDLEFRRLTMPTDTWLRVLGIPGAD